MCFIEEIVYNYSWGSVSGYGLDSEKECIAKVCALKITHMDKEARGH